jgi:acyl-CoA reductase-like NAD-dependent aldehyde dehydrogenase
MIPSSAASSTDNDDLEATIDLLRARMQAAHDSGANLSFHSWRLQALINLQTLVSENHEEIANALYEDLGKERTEAYASEIRLVENEIAYFIKNLKAWLQPTSVPSPLACLPSYSTVRLRPLAPPGVLILGPCNYPFLLCMQPAIGALAAGNPTLLKPSEACPATCHLLEKLVNKYFDPSVLTVLLGDAKTSMALTKRQWGMIFFTGSGRVGTFVAQAAANTLTPTVLELGGKCPVIVDETASCLDNTVRLQQIAHRIIWAKCWNTGQTCAAVDYVLIQENYFETLCQALVKALELQYGGNADCQTSELGRLVSVDHAQRQFDLILEASGTTDAIERGFAKTSDSGTLVFASHPENGSRISIDPHDLIRGKQIFGTWGGDVNPDLDMEKIGSYLALSRSNLELLVGEIFTIDEVNEAMAYLDSGKVGRALLKLNEE